MAPGRWLNGWGRHQWIGEHPSTAFLQTAGSACRFVGLPLCSPVCNSTSQYPARPMALAHVIGDKAEQAYRRRTSRAEIHVTCLP